MQYGNLELKFVCPRPACLASPASIWSTGSRGCRQALFPGVSETLAAEPWGGFQSSPAPALKRCPPLSSVRWTVTPPLRAAMGSPVPPSWTASCSPGEAQNSTRREQDSIGSRDFRRSGGRRGVPSSSISARSRLVPLHTCLRLFWPKCTSRRSGNNRETLNGTPSAKHLRNDAKGYAFSVVPQASRWTGAESLKFRLQRLIYGCAALTLAPLTNDRRMSHWVYEANRALVCENARSDQRAFDEFFKMRAPSS